MKSCAVLSTLLFGLCAVAAPVNKRALLVHTELVIETVVVTSTVYEGDEPAAKPTPAGEFYGKPAAPVAQPTYPAPAPPVAAKPSSAHAAAPAPQKPTPTPTPAPVAPAPAPAPEPAKPTSSAPAYVAPAPAPEPAKPSSAAPAYVAPAPAPAPAAPSSAAPAAPASGGSTSSGEAYSDVDITIYQTAGAAGACGETLNDTDMIVAIAQPAWGASTYDVMTGNATNRWCGKKVQIEYKGKTVEAKIMDMCPGCSGHDLDLSPAVWKALTGSDEMTRYKASWHLVN